MKQQFVSFDEAESSIEEHRRSGECPYARLRPAMPCQCIVSFPCKNCGEQMVKTGTAALARMGSYCSVCAPILRQERERGNVARRERLAR